MKVIYQKLNEVPTELLIWGDPADCNGSDVIVIVTGNPGVPDFYTEFATELHTNTGFPVCVIGHAGHVEVCEESNSIEKQEHLYNVEDQFKHKLALFNNYIDPKSKIHIIGHSIGAYLVVELMEKGFLRDRTASVNLLFPTLQRMAETKNGVEFKIWKKVFFLIYFLVNLLNMLPQSIILFVLRLWCKYHGICNYYDYRISKLARTAIMKQVFFFAQDELDHVKDLNVSAIDKIKHKCNVIYSSRDGWVPLNYIEDLKQFEPDITLKEVNINHTFVLKSAERVAEMVLDFIKSTLN